MGLTAPVGAQSFPNKPIRLVIPFAPGGVVVNGKAPFNTLQDLVAASKAAPGKYNFASAGAGSASHLSGEIIKEAFGIDWVHVPYRGSGPAMTNLMAGQVTVSVPGLSSAVSQVKSGALKGLAKRANISMD